MCIFPWQHDHQTAALPRHDNATNTAEEASKLPTNAAVTRPARAGKRLPVQTMLAKQVPFLHRVLRSQDFCIESIWIILHCNLAAFWAEGHGQNLFWTLPAWRHHMTFHDGCIATSSRSQVQMSPTPWCSLLPSIQSSRCNWKCRGRWRQRARILVRNNIVTFTDNSWAGHCYIVIWIIIMLNKLFHSTPKENGKIKQQMESVCKESAGGCPRFPRAATNKTRKLMGALETAGQGSSFHLVHYLSRPPLETCTKSGTTKQPNHANSFPKQHMFTAAGWICWSPIQRSCHSRGATGCLCHNSIQESKSVSQFIGWTLGKDHAAHRNHHAKKRTSGSGPTMIQDGARG